MLPAPILWLCFGRVRCAATVDHAGAGAASDLCKLKQRAAGFPAVIKQDEAPEVCCPFAGPAFV
jgi:hypothetical protein